MFRRSKRVSGRIHNILGVCADKSFSKDPANNIVHTTPRPSSRTFSAYDLAV